MSADDTAWSSALRTLLDSLLAKTINTRIFVVRAFFAGKAAQAQSTVSALGNSRVSFVDTTGWYATGAIHPLGYVSQTVLAPKAAEAIRAGLSGAPARNRFIFNSKGEPVPV